MLKRNLVGTFKSQRATLIFRIENSGFTFSVNKRQFGAVAKLNYHPFTSPFQLKYTHTRPKSSIQSRTCATLSPVSGHCSLHRKLTTATMSTGDSLPESGFRLPTNVTPTHYDLTIKSDLEKLEFSGKVEIDIQINELTSEIKLHSAPQLNVTSAQFYSTSQLEAKKIQQGDEKEECLILTFDKPLEKGQSKLGLTFSGKLEGSMMGYYKSSYELSEGQTAYYALTQFEPTAARRAFPCWDEPALKATFKVNLITKKGTVALANTDVKANVEAFDGNVPDLDFTGQASLPEASKGAWTYNSFSTTPKMSTYLLAWANGPFEKLTSSYTSPLTKETKPLAIYATKDHIHQAQFALDVKAKILPIYERIFDVAFPLPKLDTLVASDFDAGAMENWGLITGRTSVYLYDEKKSGLAARKRTAGVQSHEVSHQWFGNIVTMEWWDNLWLNEAFATLMGEIIIINEIFPEWKVHSAFIDDHLKRALQLDALRSSHPIEMPCPDSSMINQIFDAISYSKGASVLKMLANMIGEETFLKGVSLYLKAHLYGNSRTKDLWSGIAEASGVDVASIMKNWTLKVGFPVITVEETSEGIKIKQNRFLSTGDTKPEEDETIWHVPLEIKTVDPQGKAAIDHDAVLTTREATFPLKDANNRVFKLNAETCGVYRVLYSPERLSKLGAEAARTDSVLTVNDRMGLLQDAVVLAKSGYGKTSGALNLLKGLEKETENLVWAEIDGALGDLSSVWWEQPEPIRDAVNAFRRDMFAPIVKKLGFDPSEKDDPDTLELRRTAVAASAAAKDPEVLKEMKRRFDHLLTKDDDSLIPGDLRQSIFINSVRLGGEKEYEKVLSIFKKPPTPQAKVAAMISLCYGSTPELRMRTLNMLTNGEVKEQDMMYFFAGSAANCEARRAIWDFMKENFEMMSQKFKGNFSLSRLVQYSFESLTSDEDAKAVESFFGTKDTSAFNQALQQGLDSVRAKSGWLSRDAKDVEAWLMKAGYLPAGHL